MRGRRVWPRQVGAEVWCERWSLCAPCFAYLHVETAIVGTIEREISTIFPFGQGKDPEVEGKSTVILLQHGNDQLIWKLL